MSVVIGEKIKDQIKEIYPKSADRQNCAMELLGFDHDPTVEEKKELAKHFNWPDTTQINKVINSLVENKLFSTDYGSVPLYAAMIKRQIKGTFPDLPVDISKIPVDTADMDTAGTADTVDISGENSVTVRGLQQTSPPPSPPSPPQEVVVGLHLRQYPQQQPIYPQQQPAYPQQPQRQNPIIADQDRITALETNVAYIVQTVNSLTGNAKNKQKLKEGDEVVIEEDEEEDKEDVDAR